MALYEFRYIVNLLCTFFCGGTPLLQVLYLRYSYLHGRAGIAPLLQVLFLQAIYDRGRRTAVFSICFISRVVNATGAGLVSG